MADTKIIGLTGPYCAGKNHVALLLGKRLLPVLDVDKLGHEIIENEKGLLIKRFGEDILSGEGFIDRKKLGQKVFGKPKELAALEEIIHPAANKKTLEWIKARTEDACFINAALLHHSSAFELLDAIIIVEAALPVRLLRAKKRDGLPWIAIFKRFWSQRKFRYQFFARKTDTYIVRNSSAFTSLEDSLENRIDEILSLLGIGKV